jgi:hypothetical protein
MTPTPATGEAEAMTPKPKTPTPQGISALLRKAGNTRAISKLRGGVSGYSVSKYGAGPEVEVRYSSVTMGTSMQYRCAKLTEYAKAIDCAGYAVEMRPEFPRLIVTAKEG